MNGDLQTTIYSELRRELAGIRKRTPGSNGHSLREEIFERYRVTYGVRPNSWRRWERRQNGTRRADAGATRKDAYWRPIIEQIFKLQCQISDFEGGRWMAAETVLAEAVRRGIIRKAETLKGRNTESEEIPLESCQEQGAEAALPELMSETTEAALPVLGVRNYNLWVKKLGLKKPRGYTRFQAEWSNQVHQMDVTGSPYLEVVKYLGDGDYLLKRRAPRARLAKSQKAEGMRLWILGLVDDYSGVFAARYEVARGESAAFVRAGLDAIWRGLNAELSLRGLPDVLYCDNGPFAKAEETLPYLSDEMGVGVELQVHEPYRSRSTGKIERIWSSLKRGFECAFLAGREEWRLSEINEMVILWCIAQGERKHRMLEGSRAEVWQKGLKAAVRLPAEDALHSAFRTYERCVDGSGVFSLDKIQYLLPPEMRSQRVLVFRNAQKEVVCECPATGLRAQAEVWEGPHAFGEFRAYAETEMERTAKARERGEWGQIRHPQEGAETGQKAAVLPFVPATVEDSKATPFAAAARFADVLSAKLWVSGQLGITLTVLAKDYPGLKAELNELLEGTLSREEIAAWVDEVRRGWQQASEAGGGS